MHYHVLSLNKASTEADMKQAYRKLDIPSHPDKKKHLQSSAMMCMIHKDR